MPKRSGPRDPGDPIPAEFLLGKEEPDAQDDPAKTRPARGAGKATSGQHGGAPAKRAPMSRGDRAFLAGLIAVALVGGGVYLFRDDIATQYELRAHPERYWAGEVADRQLALKLSQLNEQDCLVDLLAARMKQPISAARLELLGASSSEARQWAAEETAGQEQACSAFADFGKSDRERLAAAERELARVRSR